MRKPEMITRVGLTIDGDVNGTSKQTIEELCTYIARTSCCISRCCWASNNAIASLGAATVPPKSININLHNGGDMWDGLASMEGFL